MQIPFVAMAALAGGNVRVGLEDNLYLSVAGSPRTPNSSSGRCTSWRE
jgi:uncharacterized protein (DUF849 family)